MPVSQESWNAFQSGFNKGAKPEDDEEKKRKKASDMIGKQGSSSASSKLFGSPSIGSQGDRAAFSAGATRGALTKDEYAANLRRAFGMDKKKK